MISALQNGRNLTLISPRRMGKTGLIKNVFYRMKQEKNPNTAYFYMDIYPTRDLKAFIQLLAQNVLGKLDTLSQNILRQMTAFFKSCRPIISTDERSGMPTVTLDFAPAHAEQTLKEVLDYMAASKKHCYLAIDEFQQITEYPEKGVEALLRSHIQFMPNVHFIFSGSKKHVMEEMFSSANTVYDEEVLAAAKLANCEEFAEKLPDKWNTNIGENGCALSGGERQRISIARAFLKDAPIILLDEATASLDVENETAIQEALSRLIKHKTVLVIAHRMRTVAGADKIVVLSGGIVAEQGAPDALYARNGQYTHMVDLQSASQNWTI